MVPRLQINQNFGMLAIQHTNAQVNIQQQPANVDIRQAPATVTIQTIKGQLSIDQSGPFADEGLKTSGQLSREAAQAGHKAALAYIAKTVAEGEQLKKGGNAIAELAKKNSRPPVHNFNVGLLPSSPIRISYTPAQVKVDVQVNKPQIDTSVNQVHFQTVPGTVQISMARYPSISIQVVGTQLDTQV